MQHSLSAEEIYVLLEEEASLPNGSVCTLIRFIGRENLNKTNLIGETPLMLATRGDDRVADALIRNKVNLSAQNKSGCDALMMAIRRGFKSLVVNLIENGARVDTINIDQETALSIAVARKDFRTACLLIIAGADYNHYSPALNCTILTAIIKYDSVHDSDIKRIQKIITSIETRKTQDAQKKTTEKTDIATDEPLKISVPKKEPKVAKYYVPLDKIVKVSTYELPGVGTIKFKKLGNAEVQYFFNKEPNLYELDILKFVEGVELTESREDKYLKIILDAYMKAQ